MERINILGVPFDPINMAQTLDVIESLIKTDSYHYVVTPNPEFVLAARKDAAFMHALKESDLSVADGTGVIMASRYLGRPLPGRVPGTDLATNLMPIAQKKGYKIYLLGSVPGVTELLKKVLENQYPGIKIVGAESGPHWHTARDFSTQEMKDVIERVNQSEAEILLVAFGSPKQEVFMNHFRHSLKAKVAIGIGGALNYMAGVIPRAPEWMRKMGLEWLHRLICQPSRIIRIFRAVVIFPIIVFFLGKKQR